MYLHIYTYIHTYIYIFSALFETYSPTDGAARSFTSFYARASEANTVGAKCRAVVHALQNCRLGPPRGGGRYSSVPIGRMRLTSLIM